MPKHKSPESISFENETIQGHFEKKPGCQIEIHVTAKSPLYQKSKQETLKEISKEVSLPGFRKGKVPHAMIEKHYKKIVQEESLKRLKNDVLLEAIKETKLIPLSNDKIEIQSLDTETPSFSIHFEVQPSIENVDLSLLKMEKKAAREPEDSELDELIRTLCLHHSTFEPVIDRGVEEGDFVHLTIKRVSDGVLLVDKERIEVAPGKISKWLQKALLGHTIHQTVTTTSEKEANAPEDFEPTECEITLHKIETALIPELSDELAKTMGAQSVAELRTNALLHLRNRSKEDLQHEMSTDLEKQLVEITPDFEFPTTLLDAEIKSKLETIKNQMKESGHTPEAIHKQEKELVEKAEKEALYALKLVFIFQKLSRQLRVNVSEKEVIDKVVQRLEAMNIPQSFIQQHPTLIQKLLTDLRPMCYFAVLSQKVKDILLKDFLA